MLGYITMLLVCQLAGEVLVRLTGLPLPGPVAGMVILLAGLMVKGGIPDGLNSVGGTLLRYLALLFVPAGVGVVAHLELVGRQLLPIAAAILLGTLLTIAVTGLVVQALTPKEKP